MYSIKMENELQMFEMMYNFENYYASSKYIINDDYGSWVNINQSKTRGNHIILYYPKDLNY